MLPPTSLPLRAVRLRRGLLAERAALVRDTVIPYQWEALNDRVPGAEPSGCVQNFQIAAGERAGKHLGLVFQDSDLAKWIEAASHRLATHADPALDATLDTLIATLAKAQQPDGYLNTWFTLVAPAGRWQNLRDEHELYCAGHLIEAGVAHFSATGKRTLLTVCVRLADCIDEKFGDAPGQTRGYCGHQEIELALVKLARATAEPRYAALAAYFIRERGRAPLFFVTEAERRAEKKAPWYVHAEGLRYWQAAQPVTELTEPVGHAVRMMYLACAMADLARENSDAALAHACRTLWTATVRGHLYLTGGVGSDGPGGEKFSEPFDLPPDRAYSETCAAIGLMMWARRMLDLELRGEFADVMERALYNNVLAGMALDGTKFFYVNPLALVPAVAQRRYECHHVKTQRVPWFGCACCPPNIARLLASLGDYVATRTPGGLALHLYTDGEIECDGHHLAVTTDYPWSEKISLVVTPPTDASEFTLRLRVPGWCRGASLALNGTAHPLIAPHGYATLTRVWHAGDLLTLTLPMPAERVRADPRVSGCAGHIALQRGPVVYCLEQADHGGDLAALTLPRDAVLTARHEPALLGGCTVIAGEALRETLPATLYPSAAPTTERVPLRAIPYALWANRGEGELRVWLRES